MGNSPPSGLRLSGGDQCYQVELGESAGAIRFNGREVARRSEVGGVTESWKMSYKVGMTSECKFSLSKTNNDKLDMEVNDDGQRAYHVTVQKSETSNDLDVIFSKCENPWSLWPNRSLMSFECAVGSSYVSKEIYENYLSQVGLVVCEYNKYNDDILQPTVTHYYANTFGSRDVGLSVTVKVIRVSDDANNLDFIVDGPERHPAAALFYMFDKVRQTGTWNPSFCPHCAQKYIIPRQPYKKREDKTPPPPPPKAQELLLQYGHQQSSSSNVALAGRSSLVANDGNFKGDHNGNFIINRAYIVQTQRCKFSQYESEDSDMDNRGHRAGILANHLTARKSGSDHEEDRDSDNVSEGRVHGRTFHTARGTVDNNGIPRSNNVRRFIKNFFERFAS